MDDREIQAIKARHAFADSPVSIFNPFIRVIDLIYSGEGKRAHSDRGKLLAEIDRLQGEKNGDSQS